ncbi:NTP transferase domain-containing protein [Patescibacteria group bacterium]|nr:NTP transferase domain-containing protein [Patescibacteria group bacterium]
MKGVILAGGLGTRLHPLTLITNKHLLPIYNKPMILYPLETLRQSGLKEIMIVCGKEHGGDFMNFLGSGKEYGVKFSFALQDGPGGIAEALGLAENFADKGKIAVILGDNLFEESFSEEVEKFKSQDGAKVFVKEVNDPGRFGVAEVKGDRIVSIEEKPHKPKSNYAVTGFYLYNFDVFNKIKRLKPSERGELEITDVHTMYIQEGNLSYAFIDSFWSDAGTFESLLTASNRAAERMKNSNP